MIFSEIHSVYYHTVAKILTAALQETVTEKDLQKQVEQHAFSESVLTILPALKSGKWQLMREDLSPVLYQAPKRPLSLLEKRWLKSLYDDPRMRLFADELPAMEDIEPLFTREDYTVYDQYADGDPFTDESYIRNFRRIRQAIKEKRPVIISMVNRRGAEKSFRFYPIGFEYSLKDDKIRVLAEKCMYHQFNLARILHVDFYVGDGPWRTRKKVDRKKELVLEITDERNALERAMLHFAHLEKQAERVDEQHYLLKLKYYASDETELVIRVLSFGPLVKVLEPESFVQLIKKRLRVQFLRDLQ